jgi:hypothetical protein
MQVRRRGEDTGRQNSAGESKPLESRTDGRYAQSAVSVFGPEFAAVRVSRVKTPATGFWPSSAEQGFVCGLVAEARGPRGKSVRWTCRLLVNSAVRVSRVRTRAEYFLGKSKKSEGFSGEARGGQRGKPVRGRCGHGPRLSGKRLCPLSLGSEDERRSEFPTLGETRVFFPLLPERRTTLIPSQPVFYRLRLSMTSPSAPISSISRGMRPRACVAQLRQGS